jgi:hypothetical protein
VSRSGYSRGTEEVSPAVPVVVMEEHDAFFQRIIGLIPKELYKASDEEDESMNSRYFKHRLQPLQASERKVLSKKRKLEKYGGAGEGGDDGDSDGAGDSDGSDDDEEVNESDDENDDAAEQTLTTRDSNLPTDPKVRLRVSSTSLNVSFFKLL